MEQGTPFTVAKGVEQFQLSADTDPSFAPPNDFLADIYLDAKRHTPAKKALLRLQQYNPQTEHIYCRFAETELLRSNYDAARPHAEEEVRRAPNCFQGHYLLGSIMWSLFHEKIAVEQFRLALEIKPEDVNALLKLAEIVITNMHYDEGEELAKRLLTINPTGDEAQRKAMKVMGHYYLGFCYERNNKIPDHLNKAKANLLKAIQLNSNHDGSHHELGRVYMQMNRLEEALDHLLKSKELNSSYAGAHYDLAILYRRLGKLQEAKKAQADYERIQELDERERVLNARRGADPNNPNIFRQLAEVKREKEKDAEADEYTRFAEYLETNQERRAKPQTIEIPLRTSTMPDDIQPSKPNDLFTDITKEAGITFVHTNGGWGRRYFLEETGSGCALFDFDNDNWLDIFILQAGQVPGTSQSGSTQGSDGNHLYRNNRDGTFSNVTEGSGLQHTGYAQGVSVADYDNDNFDDLLITAYGRNFLFHNEGGTGKFTDVTQHAGLTPTDGGSHWSTSCAFGDYDKDGDLDLFISRYVEWTLNLDVDCFDPTTKKRGYCSPLQYNPTTDVLYRNNGDSTFSDVTREAGLGELKGKGLATAWLDFNKDGFQDLFVACDLTPDFLLRNNQDGTFTDVALEAGVAYSDGGLALAGMGIGIGDYNNDGFEDLFVTNFSKQGNFLHHNDGNGFFTNRSYPSRVAPISMKFLGFGCEFLDFDCDGFKDILVANGHVSDDIEETNRGINYAQRQSLYHNNGDSTFSDTTENIGALALRRVSRGLAIGDIDNDGDIDALFNNQNAPPQLLRNNYRANNHWVSFKLSGTRTHKNARHAKVTLHANGLSQYAEVRSGSSYCSHSDTRLTFGLGTAETVDKLEVAWFNGETESFQDIPANTIWHIVEGQGKMNKISSSSLPLTLP